MNDKILSMEHITKEFPSVKALDDVHLNAYKGKVMALLGENGAGKSTLMKILSGVYKKTSGSIYYNGKELNVNNTRQANEHGISIIHQELNLINELTIGENIFLGREPKTKLGLIDWKKLYTKSETLLKDLDINLDPKTKIKDLSIGVKQMVEIAKALSFESKLIIMDEPTDALTDKESQSLFKVIEKLKNEGKSIIYISHRLNEIFKICDDVTIIRDGKFVAEHSVKEINQDILIELMVGRKLEEQFPYQKDELGEILLEVKGIKNKYIQDVSFQIREKEIVGVAGLMGAGRTELAKSIYGHYKIDSGEIILNDKRLSIKSEKDAIQSGISYVSEDRKKDGLVLGMNVMKNISLSSLDKISKLKVINKSTEKKLAIDYINNFNIKTPSEEQKLSNLSGGNQQKVSISKSLLPLPKVLIMDEPTRGIDVGAKKEIYNLMNKFKSDGMGILMISSEIPELLGMCDRILVMHEGKMMGEVNRKEMSQEAIMRLAVGIRS